MFYRPIAGPADGGLVVNNSGRARFGPGGGGAYGSLSAPQPGHVMTNPASRAGSIRSRSGWKH